MPANLVTVEDLERVKAELIQEITHLFNQKGSTFQKKWLKSNEVRRILLVSPGTLQNLRVNGTLPFTKIGGVIFYDIDDIQKMINSNKQNARK